MHTRTELDKPGSRSVNKQKKSNQPFQKSCLFQGEESRRNMGEGSADEPPAPSAPPPASPSIRLRVAFEPRGLGADDHAGPRISAAAERRNRKANVAAEMYAATAGSSISGDQSGMRILGFCLWVRFHLHSNPGIFSRPVEPQISTSPSPGRHVLTNLL